MTDQVAPRCIYAIGAAGPGLLKRAMDRCSLFARV